MVVCLWCTCHVCVCVYEFTHTWGLLVCVVCLCIHVCVHLCVLTCMYICVFICVSVYACVC